MEEVEKIICDFMYDFTKKNWDKINKVNVEIGKSKTAFLTEVKSNVDTAMWVLTEVCQWGMDKVYLKELYMDMYGDHDFSVIKIKNKYIKLKWLVSQYQISFCEPKTKTVIYFD